MSEAPKTPSEAIAPVKVHAPSDRNRKLSAFLAAANADTRLKARWLAQQTTAERLGMSDHSWVHLQIVLNMALRLYRMLHKHGIKSAIERDHAMNTSDAEVIIAGGCLLHDLGMSIHRVDHEAYSLFLAADSLDRLLEGVYEEPERTIIASEILHAIIGHRSAGRPLTLEAAFMRAADANPALAAARLRRPIDQANELVARERPNPDVSVELERDDALRAPVAVWPPDSHHAPGASGRESGSAARGIRRGNPAAPGDSDRPSG